MNSICQVCGRSYSLKDTSKLQDVCLTCFVSQEVASASARSTHQAQQIRLEGEPLSLGGAMASAFLRTIGSAFILAIVVALGIASAIPYGGGGGFWIWVFILCAIVLAIWIFSPFVQCFTDRRP